MTLRHVINHSNLTNHASSNIFPDATLIHKSPTGHIGSVQEPEQLTRMSVFENGEGIRGENGYPGTPG